MSDKYEKEIEEILKRAEDGLPKDRARPQSQRTEPAEQTPGPVSRLTSGRKLRISAGKLMLISFGLFLLALILGATSLGFVLPLVVGGLVLFVIAYALFFVKPGSGPYEKRWRGRIIEENASPFERIKRWLKG